MNFLTDFKPGKDPWNHTTSKFITYWIEQLCRYDEYTYKVALTADGLSDVSPDKLKMILLNFAVFNIPDLFRVALSQPTFEKYLSLFYSAVIQHD